MFCGAFCLDHFAYKVQISIYVKFNLSKVKKHVTMHATKENNNIMYETTLPEGFAVRKLPTVVSRSVWISLENSLGYLLLFRSKKFE